MNHRVVRFISMDVLSAIKKIDGTTCALRYDAVLRYTVLYTDQIDAVTELHELASTQ